MRRTLTSALPHATPGEQVRLQGWVHRRRELAKVTFLVVRDRSGLAQVVLPAGSDLPSEETPVEIWGIATRNEQAPGGSTLPRNSYVTVVIQTLVGNCLMIPADSATAISIACE